MLYIRHLKITVGLSVGTPRRSPCEGAGETGRNVGIRENGVGGGIGRSGGGRRGPGLVVTGTTVALELPSRRLTVYRSE